MTFHFFIIVFIEDHLQTSILRAVWAVFAPPVSKIGLGFFSVLFVQLISLSEVILLLSTDIPNRNRNPLLSGALKRISRFLHLEDSCSLIPLFVFFHLDLYHRYSSLLCPRPVSVQLANLEANTACSYSKAIDINQSLRRRYRELTS